MSCGGYSMPLSSGGRCDNLTAQCASLDAANSKCNKAWEVTPCAVGEQVRASYNGGFSAPTAPQQELAAAEVEDTRDDGLWGGFHDRVCSLFVAPRPATAPRRICK